MSTTLFIAPLSVVFHLRKFGKEGKRKEMALREKGKERKVVGIVAVVCCCCCGGGGGL